MNFDILAAVLQRANEQVARGSALASILFDDISTIIQIMSYVRLFLVKLPILKLSSSFFFSQMFVFKNSCPAKKTWGSSRSIARGFMTTCPKKMFRLKIIPCGCCQFGLDLSFPR